MRKIMLGLLVILSIFLVSCKEERSDFLKLTLPDNVTANVSELGHIESGSEIILTFDFENEDLVDVIKLNGEEITLTNNKYTFIIKKDSEVTITYKVETFYKLTLVEGVLANVDNLNKIKEGTTVELSFNLDNELVDKVLLNGKEITTLNNKYSFTINEDSEVVITYIEETFYKLTLVEGVLANVDNLNKIKEGTTVELSFNLDNELVDKVLLNGKEITIVNNKYSFIINSDIEISVIYLNETYYQLTLPKYVSSNLINLDHILEGTSITLTVDLPNELKFVNLKINDEVVTLTNNSYTFILKEDVLVSLNYTLVDDIDYKTMSLLEIYSFLTFVKPELFIDNVPFKIEASIYEEDVELYGMFYKNLIKALYIDNEDISNFSYEDGVLYVNNLKLEFVLTDIYLNLMFNSDFDFIISPVLINKFTEFTFNKYLNDLLKHDFEDNYISFYKNDDLVKLVIDVSNELIEETLNSFGVDDYGEFDYEINLQIVFDKGYLKTVSLLIYDNEYDETIYFKFINDSDLVIPKVTNKEEYESEELIKLTFKDSSDNILLEAPIPHEYTFEDEEELEYGLKYFYKLGYYADKFYLNKNLTTEIDYPFTITSDKTIYVSFKEVKPLADILEIFKGSYGFKYLSYGDDEFVLYKDDNYLITEDYIIDLNNNKQYVFNGDLYIIDEDLYFDNINSYLSDLINKDYLMYGNYYIYDRVILDEDGIMVFDNSFGLDYYNLKFMNEEELIYYKEFLKEIEDGLNNAIIDEVSHVYNYYYDPVDINNLLNLPVWINFESGLSKEVLLKDLGDYQITYKLPLTTDDELIINEEKCYIDLYDSNLGTAIFLMDEGMRLVYLPSLTDFPEFTGNEFFKVSGYNVNDKYFDDFNEFKNYCSNKDYVYLYYEQSLNDFNTIVSNLKDNNKSVEVRVNYNDFIYHFEDEVFEYDNNYNKFYLSFKDGFSFYNEEFYLHIPNSIYDLSEAYKLLDNNAYFYYFHREDLELLSLYHQAYNKTLAVSKDDYDDYYFTYNDDVHYLFYYNRGYDYELHLFDDYLNEAIFNVFDDQITILTNNDYLYFEYLMDGYDYPVLKVVETENNYVYFDDYNKLTVNVHYNKILTILEQSLRFSNYDYYTLNGWWQSYKYLKDEQIQIYDNDELLFLYNIITKELYYYDEEEVYYISDYLNFLDLNECLNEEEFYFEDAYYKNDRYNLEIKNDRVNFVMFNYEFNFDEVNSEEEVTFINYPTNYQSDYAEIVVSPYFYEDNQDVRIEIIIKGSYYHGLYKSLSELNDYFNYELTYDENYNTVLKLFINNEVVNVIVNSPLERFGQYVYFVDLNKYYYLNLLEELPLTEDSLFYEFDHYYNDDYDHIYTIEDLKKSTINNYNIYTSLKFKESTYESLKELVLNNSFEGSSYYDINYINFKDNLLSFEGNYQDYYLIYNENLIEFENIYFEVSNDFLNDRFDFLLLINLLNDEDVTGIIYGSELYLFKDGDEIGNLRFYENEFSIYLYDLGYSNYFKLSEELVFDNKKELMTYKIQLDFINYDETVFIYTDDLDDLYYYLLFTVDDLFRDLITSDIIFYDEEDDVIYYFTPNLFTDNFLKLYIN